MPTVLAILAEGFEELEATAPIDLLRRAGATVTTAALSDGLHKTGRSGLTMHADTTLAALMAGGDAIGCACLFLPGGPGVRLVRSDSRIRDIVRRHHDSGRWFAAICAAPTVLHDAGLLAGRRYIPIFLSPMSCPHSSPRSEPWRTATSSRRAVPAPPSNSAY